MLADATATGLDRAHEWVELVNAGDEPVSTAGWSIGDDRALDPLPVAEVPPGGFLVVAGAAAVLPEGAAVVRLADGAIGAGLRNDGDAVRLVSPAGALVDAISWGDDGSVFAPPLPAARAGATLGARGHGDAPDRERWGTTLAPSPGAPNRFPATAAAATPAFARYERDGDSRAPWVALGAAAGAGTTLTLIAFIGGTRALGERRRRGD